jgi:hypothetical protein
MTRRSAAIVLATAVSLGKPAFGYAQSATPAWEIEGHGGGAAVASVTSATKTAPPLGPSILTSGPQFPGRQAPSWFFGDGASQLNGALAAFHLSAAVTPLDSAFNPLGSGKGAGGARVTRRLTSSFGIEVSVDVIAGSTSAVSSLKAAAQSASSSFQSTFATFLTTGPFTGVAVDSTNSVTGGAGLELATTAALRWHLAPHASWSPYVTIGGGLMTRPGSLASATLDGHYQFSILGATPIDERDHAVVHYQATTSPIVVAGFGISHALGSAWAVNLDARVLIGAADSALRLDAAPSGVTSNLAGFVELDTVPTVQFSNNASTGRQSTLGGSLSGFTVVSGGVSARTLVTFGLARRF